MKKTFLYIAVSSIGFGLMLTNCSKKTDPAPAPATSTTGSTTTGTTSGSTTTTTAGSTTSATSSGSTTTSTTAGSTTSTTSSSTTSSTTSGTTTSGTTSGSTTSSTSSGTTTSVPSSDNSWVVDNVSYSSGASYAWANSTMVASDATGKNFCQIYFSEKPTVSGTYNVVSFLSAAQQTAGDNKASIIIAINSVQYWSKDNSGTLSVTVSGGIVTATFNNKNIPNYLDGSKLITASGKLKM